MNTIREQCEQCLSFNYLDDNVENIGYEAFECWNCHTRHFLPDEGLFRFMDRTCTDEFDALQVINESEEVIFVDGRAVP